MTCIPRPFPSNNPVLVHSVVSALQIHFETSFQWLEIVYGLVKTGEIKEGSKTLRYPQIYTNDGTKNHIDIRPDDKLKSFCFFEANNSFPFESFDANDHGIFTYNLGIVFWFNLQKIDNRDYDFTPELMNDVIKTGLFQSTIKSDIKLISTDDRPAKVFEKYQFDLAEKQLLIYPFTGFRVDISVKQEIDPCHTPFSVTGDLNACQETR